MIAVAVYARFSTDKQDPRSIGDQLRRCEQLVASRPDWQIVSVYSDAAASGSHTDRVELQRLLADARKKIFQFVLVDDLSRLSRDLGGTWKIIYGDLAGCGVHVVDCSTGRSSNDHGARLEIGVRALMNDQQLEQIRRQTHRGLEGRALAGFHTGGRTYGFRSVPEPNPADIFHPRKVLVIHADEAKIVLRIFTRYADGVGIKTIAAELNQEGIPAPHDGGRGHKKVRGWSHTTIRHMLRNENYVGIFTWNRHRFEQKPGTNSYRHVPRPADEHIRRENANLRIVPLDLWQSVQSLIGDRKTTTKGMRLGTSRRPSAILSGLLKCGSCGGSLVIVAQRSKNGVTYGRLGCGVRRSRGPAICANAGTLSELPVEAVIGTLQRKLSDPALTDAVLAGFQEHMNETAKNDAVADLERQQRKAEQRLANITEALAAGFSEAILRQVKIEEDALNGIRSKLAAAKAVTRPKVLAHPVLTKLIGRMADVLKAGDPDQGKALLRRHLPPVVVTPVPGGYCITGAFGINLNIAESGASEDGPEFKTVGGTGIEPATRAV